MKARLRELLRASPFQPFIIRRTEGQQQRADNSPSNARGGLDAALTRGASARFSTKPEAELRLTLQQMRPVPALLSRRHFLNQAGLGLGVVALASLLNEKLFAAQAKTMPAAGGLPGLPHFAAKAKRVIYLFQSGA